MWPPIRSPAVRAASEGEGERGSSASQFRRDAVLPASCQSSYKSHIRYLQGQSQLIVAPLMCTRPRTVLRRVSNPKFLRRTPCSVREGRAPGLKPHKYSIVQSCFIMVTGASGLYGDSAGSVVNSHGACPQAAGQPKFARRRAGESGPAGASTGVGGPVDALLPVSPQSHSRSGELMPGVDGWEASGVGGTDEVGSSAAAAAYFSRQARCAPCPQPEQNR